MRCGPILLLALLSAGPGAADPLFELGAALGASADGGIHHDYPRDFGLSASIAARGRFNVLAGYAEVGFATAASDRDRDPTFDLGSARYWVMPILFGVRANVDPTDPTRSGTSRFDVGLAAVIAPTWWDDALRTRHAGSTWGIAFDAGPGWAIGQRWGVWVRGRALLLGDTRYGDNLGTINHSRGELRIGTWLGPNGTARRTRLVDRGTP